jgi:hypothetical protein
MNDFALREGYHNVDRKKRIAALAMPPGLPDCE